MLPSLVTVIEPEGVYVYGQLLMRLELTRKMRGTYFGNAHVNWIRSRKLFIWAVL